MNCQIKLNCHQQNITVFFLGKIYFTSNDGSQNMFVYQPAFNVLELKKDKSTKYVIH